MQQDTVETIREAVRETYGKIADGKQSGCGCASTGCCSASEPDLASMAYALGYGEADVTSVPDGANLGLGCGNPQAIASLKPGEVVLDLGSGAGFDCFLAGRAVGAQGHVIGVDMTPAMVSKARQNLTRSGLKNIDFRLGEIEHLPVADASVDVIISNCVINLSLDKGQVFRDAYRVLKPGGRVAVSDMVAVTYVPEALQKDVALHTGCLAGASLIPDIKRLMHDAGFEQIRITAKSGHEPVSGVPSATTISDYVVSAVIEAVKPSL